MIPSNYKVNEESKKNKLKEKDLLKNIEPDFKNLQKYDPMVNKEIMLKYSFNKIMMDIEKMMKEIDLRKFKAPFLPYTFHVWRYQAWEKLQKFTLNMSFESKQKWNKKFINKVDGNYLINFFHFLKEPYFNLVFFEHYQMPSEVKNSKFKDDNYLCINSNSIIN